MMEKRTRRVVGFVVACAVLALALGALVSCDAEIVGGPRHHVWGYVKEGATDEDLVRDLQWAYEAAGDRYERANYIDGRMENFFVRQNMGARGWTPVDVCCEEVGSDGDD